jgi:hypothetical protein
MIELQQDDFLEETEFDFNDLEKESLNDSKMFPENAADRATLERIPDEGRAIGKGEKSFPHPTDPLSAYYKSMSKIPLLKREQEVYLAKKIEAAKLNVLRLLSLTTITSSKILAMANELQPAEIPAAIPRLVIEEKRKAENDTSFEERSRIRMRLVRKGIARLDELENRYRLARRRFQKCKSHNGNGNKDLNREAIFAILQRINFRESQINELIANLEDVLHMMEQSQLEVRAHPKKQKHEQKSSRCTHSNLAELEAQYLTNIEELRRILQQIAESKV